MELTKKSIGNLNLNSLDDFDKKAELKLSEVKYSEILIDISGFKPEISDGVMKLTRKKDYPQTFEECLEMFGVEETIVDSSHEDISALQKLILCRNAWRVCDNDWHPDWSDNTSKACIVFRRHNDVVFRTMSYEQRIFSFRDIKIAESFYKTFKDLFDKCYHLC
jgi:hypothetical protein